MRFNKKLGLSLAAGAATIILLFVLWKAMGFLLISFLGILFAIFLGSLTNFTQRWTRLPYQPALFVVLLILLAFFFLVGWRMLNDIAAQFGELFNRLPDAISGVRRNLSESTLGREVLERFKNTESWLESSALLGRANTLLSASLGSLTNFLVILVIGFFLALSPDLYIRGFVRLFPLSNRKSVRGLLVEIGRTLNWWLVGRAIAMVTIGLSTWIGLELLDVQPALALGVLAGLLSFIPFLGPILSVVPALLVAFQLGYKDVLFVAALYGGIQLVESNILTPLIERKTVFLPPALTLLAQMIGTILFGILGMLLASPIAAVSMLLIKRIYIESYLESDSKQKTSS